MTDVIFVIRPDQRSTFGSAVFRILVLLLNCIIMKIKKIILSLTMLFAFASVTIASDAKKLQYNTLQQDAEIIAIAIDAKNHQEQNQVMKRLIKRMIQKNSINFKHTTFKNKPQSI